MEFGYELALVLAGVVASGVLGGIAWIIKTAVSNKTAAVESKMHIAHVAESTDEEKARVEKIMQELHEHVVSCSHRSGEVVQKLKELDRRTQNVEAVVEKLLTKIS